MSAHTEIASDGDAAGHNTVKEQTLNQKPLFTDWMAGAKRGETLVYFEGELARERVLASKLRAQRMPIPDTMAFDLESAGDAWRAFENGHVTLTQAKAPGVYDYFYRAHRL